MSKFLDENGLSYFWSKIKASLKTVAFTGSYNDLTNKPNIPQGATVDTELNSSSTNPVQNKAIHSALATKVTSAQAIQAVSGAGYATSANASAIASSLISAGGYVTSTYVAGATVASAGAATNATSLGGSAASVYEKVGHTHSYLPLSGGTVTGNVTISGLFTVPNYRGTDSIFCRSTTSNTVSGGTERVIRMNAQTNGNMGIYDISYNKWMLRANASGNLIIDQDLTISGGATVTNKMVISGAGTNPANQGLRITGTGNYALALQNTTITKGTAPTAANNYIGIDFFGSANDSYNKRLALIETNTTSANQNCLQMVAYHTNNATNTGGASIKLYTSNGVAWTETLTPTATDSSTKIATTAFVKAQEYLTSPVAIANGGTGQTTRLAAIKALTNENVSTNATHFLGLKSDWSKVGYVSVADAKTVLGLGTAAYTASTAYAAASHTHSYLPLGGGTLTGSLTISRGNPYLYFVETDWSKGTPQTSGTSYQGIYFSGSNAEGGHITFHYQQDKTSYLALTCQNLTSATANSNTTVFITTASNGTKHVRPGSNNDTDLGLSGYKWNTVYATTFSGDLAGNATTATNASSLGGTAASGYSKTNHTHSYLPLTGGTCTGTIIIQSDADHGYVVKESVFAMGKTVSGSAVFKSLGAHHDKNGVTMGGIHHQFSTTGLCFLQLRNMSNKASGYITQEVRLETNTAGSVQYFYATGTGCSLGKNTSNRWSQVVATSTSITTSDERYKTSIEAIPEDVLDAWGDVNWIQYQYIEAVEKKGENVARLHSGIIAQRIVEIFANHNLDATRYGLLCYDEWEEEPETRNENGEVIASGTPAGNMYSLRYEECLCMEAAYQRRRAERAEARITALEQRFNELEEVLVTLGDHSNAS